MAEYPYDTQRWKRLRRAHLRMEPLCRGCAPHRLTVASHVDHVLAISQGGDPFPSHDGLASLCLACHSAKTARGAEAGAARTTKPRKGCDANGNPLDPTHAWSDTPAHDDREKIAQGWGLPSASGQKNSISFDLLPKASI